MASSFLGRHYHFSYSTSPLFYIDGNFKVPQNAGSS
jgi:hypothetical protein